MKLGNQKLIIWIGILVIPLISACATTKQATFSASNDVKLYKFIQISDLSVTSDSDKADEGAKEATDRIQAFYKQELTKDVSASNKSIVPASPQNSPAGEKILVVDGSLDVHFGSRALRYWVGFGAGKGYATLTLTAKDKDTGEVKYNDVRTDELVMGGFGGSFEDMIEATMKEQIQQFVVKTQ